MVRETKMTRRGFVRVSALAAMGVIVAACAPKVVEKEVPVEVTRVVKEVVKETIIVEGTPQVVEKEVTRVIKETVVIEATAKPEPAGWTGTIEMFAQSYNPTRILLNPDPNAPKVTAIDTLANEWMDLHPGIEFKFINAPTGDYHDWIVVQLIGGTGPDIFWRWLGSLNDHADKGQVVILNDYLELPNKYMPGDKRPWKEHFKSPFQGLFSPQGNHGGVPLDLVSTGMYVNVDMLREAGIEYDDILDKELGSVKSWAAFMDILKTVKDAGFMACSPGPGVSNQWWINGVLTDQIMWKWIETMDLLNYHERPMYYQEGIISQEEICHRFFCEDWNPWEDPATRTEFEIIKDWVQYFPEGWAAEDFGRPFDLFCQGELCMYWDGTWQVGQLQADDRRTFEFKSMWLPPVTQETTPLADDPPRLPIGVGGYGSITYGINHKCAQKGNVDECVDFLMYITTPEHDALIVNEVPKFIPSHVDAKALPEIESMFVGETRLIAGAGHPIINPVSWFGHQEIRWGDIFFRESVLYYIGEQDLDTTMANLHRLGTTNAEALLREAAMQYNPEGDWDLTKWKCQPEV